MEKSNGCTCGQGKSRGKCASCKGEQVGNTGKIRSFLIARAKKMADKKAVKSTVSTGIQTK